MLFHIIHIHTDIYIYTYVDTHNYLCVCGIFSIYIIYPFIHTHKYIHKLIGVCVCAWDPNPSMAHIFYIQYIYTYIHTHTNIHLFICVCVWGGGGGSKPKYGAYFQGALRHGRKALKGRRRRRSRRWKRRRRRRRRMRLAS